MRPSSRLIRAMPRLISPVETRHKHEEVKRALGQKRIPSHISGSKPIPKKTAIMDRSGKFRPRRHRSMTAGLTSQKKVKLYIGTRGILALNHSGSMEQWNGVYGITPLVSGITWETNGSQENDLPARDHTPSLKQYSNRLILWSRLLLEYMPKWSLLQWVSTSVLSVLSNTEGWFSGCYLVWKKTGDFKREYTEFSGNNKRKRMSVLLHSKSFALFEILLNPNRRTISGAL